VLPRRVRGVLDLHAREEAGELLHRRQTVQVPDLGVGEARRRAVADGRTDLGGGVRQERGQHHAEVAERVGQRDQHAVQARTLKRILGQRPWLVAVDVTVDAADELPDRGQRALEGELLHRRLDGAPGGGRGLADGRLLGPRRRRCPRLALVVDDQRGGARHQVAEIVGQVRR
jgi:hypothetical protein